MHEMLLIRGLTPSLGVQSELNSSKTICVTLHMLLRSMLILSEFSDSLCFCFPVNLKMVSRCHRNVVLSYR